MGVYYKNTSTSLPYTGSRTGTGSPVTVNSQRYSKLVTQNGSTNGTRKARAAALKAAGYQAPTAYTSSRTDVEQFTLGVMSYTQSAPLSPGSWVYQDDFGLQANSDGYMSVTLSDINYSSLRAKAIAKCNAEVRDLRTALGEMMGEVGYDRNRDLGNRTCNMLANTAHRIIDAYTWVKKGCRAPASSAERRRAFDRARRGLGFKEPRGRRNYWERTKKVDPASLWLEWRYGWTPLLGDTYGAMTLLWDKMRTPENLVRVVKARGSGSEKTVRYSPLRGYDWQGNGWSTWGATNLLQSVNYRLKLTEERTVRCEIGYVVRGQNSLTSTLQQLGLDNPAMLAWELTTLSFVADWFVNVSDVLEQITAFTGVTYLTGWESKTRTSRLTTKYEVVDYRNYGGRLHTLQTPAQAVVFKRDFSRTVLTTPPILGLSFHNALTTKRLVDAAALLRNVFR